MSRIGIKSPLKALFCTVLAFSLTVVSGGGYLFFKARASLPMLDGEVKLDGLESTVTVISDQYGIPKIIGRSRLDAIRALGYVTARDRLFQMDLMRRQSAGTLAEILGEAVLAEDRRQRSIGLNHAAKTIAENLPGDQKEVLQAYAEGVNNFITQMKAPPFEFLLLGYRPAPWSAQDSLLVILSMFQTLSWGETEERMMTVMKKTLSPAVVSFLTPEKDHYTRALLEEAIPPLPAQPIPVEALVSLLPPPAQRPEPRADVVRMPDSSVGSNAWAVGRSKTVDGRAILANDMHLALSVPNIWYRAEVRYGDVALSGVTLPGIPLLIAGTNGNLAWGFTSIAGDFLDLVLLEVNPKNPDEYKTPEGWRPFDKRQEIIRVKGGADVRVEVIKTIWGPVASDSLLGQPVAIRWTGFDPTAVDLGLLYMDQAKTLEDGIAVMNRASGPPNNVILADDRGRIAWTYTGKIPIRKGFDGAISLSWAEGTVGWEGFIPPEALPRIVDPPSGFLVSANQRMLGKEYPYLIGHDFDAGYRAYRITERLQAMSGTSEESMLSLQLDTTSHIYNFYQKLALDLLTEETIRQKSFLSEIRSALTAWNGRADVDSLGFGILVQFRKDLARGVFAPFLQPCLEEDPNFWYEWSSIDTPLERLLTERIPALLPDPAGYADWNAFILGKLEESAGRLKRTYGIQSLHDLTWGRMNIANVSHPLTGILPGLTWLLDMPRDPLPGCGFCVRVNSRAVAASERLVISPGRAEEGFLHMPGGQSGHPLSPHYRDHQEAWVAGRPLPFLAGPPRHRLTLIPAGHAIAKEKQTLTQHRRPK